LQRVCIFFLSSFISISSTSDCASDSKQICEQLHDDSDSVSEISHNIDIDITAHSDPDAKINRSDLSNTSCNSGDGQACANDASGSSGGDNNEDDDENLALWDKNDHYFCKRSFHA
jgi:hypothetical protein